MPPDAKLAGANPDLSIVVPVYRSEDCLEALVSGIQEVLAEADLRYEVVLVNDGSPDGSWHVIEGICARSPNVVGVDLRRNFGQHNAVMTGFRIARGKFIVTMDDDLQHDPHDIPSLLAVIQEPTVDVVYGQYQAKQHGGWKNAGSWLNGKVAEWLIDKPPDVYLSPFRAIKRDIAKAITAYEGPDPYLDGLLAQNTSRFAQIPVEHRERHSGKGNYTLISSIRMWARLVFSFSVKPIRMVSAFGMCAALLGLAAAIFIVARRFLDPDDMASEALGWASTMTVILILGGLQLFFLGVLGEYVGRTHLNMNRKPQAVAAQILNGDEENARLLRPDGYNDS